MDNKDLLRVDNEENKKDEQVVSVQFKTNTLKVEKKKNSIATLISDEVSKYKLKHNKEVIEVEKPKIIIPLTLILLSIVVTIVLILISQFSTNISLIPIIILLLAMGIPLTFIYFFYSLNTHNDIHVGLMVCLFVIGVFLYVFYYIFNRQFTNMLKDISIISTIVSCLLLSSLLLIPIIIIYEICKYNNYMSMLLLGVVIAAGFICAMVSFEVFNSLFYNIQVFEGGQRRTINAIINDQEYISLMINQLIENIFRLGFVKPIVIMITTLVNSFIIRYASVKNESGKYNSATSYLVIILNILLVALSQIESSINILQITLEIISLVIALLELIKTIDFSCKKEIYK